jgi:DNA-binding transcriptional LysR family regulator
MNNLDDLTMFAAVVEAGGFRLAAHRNRMSASSLSDAVRRLEDGLDVRLLNRTTRSVTPTEAGQRLLQRIRPALAEIAEAVDGVASDSGRPSGTLRLNVPTIVADYILPQIAARFLTAHSGVRLDIVAQDSFVDVLAAGFDAGIRYEESIAQDMIAIPIGPRRQRFAVCAAPAYLERHGTPRHPRELANHAKLGYRFAGGALSVWDFERETRRIRVVPDGPLIASSWPMVRAAAIAGLGVVAGFEEHLRAEVGSGALIRILADWQTDFSGPFLYYQTRRHMPPPLRAFVDFVRKAENPA